MSAPPASLDVRGFNLRTHGAGGYSRGCRCDTCRTDRARSARDRRAEAASRRLAAEAAGRTYVATGITHGTISGYRDASCRCEPCRQRAMGARRGIPAPAPAPATPAPSACIRCNGASAGTCCSSHGKALCHRCYRLTHFVGRCVEGCEQCAREGMDPMTWPEPTVQGGERHA